MYRIVQKDMLTPNVISLRFQAPNIARRVHLGQFVIIRTDEGHIPITISVFGTEKSEQGTNCLFHLGNRHDQASSRERG